MADHGFRPPKQWKLTESETITSYASWQASILYYISLSNEFASFLDAEWQKISVTNRGLQADGDKTGAQRNAILGRMLGLIAQFSPSLLYNDIINRSTSLNYIWKRIRKHYSFTQSEVNFLKLADIKREEGERYETFFQRIVAHLEDNLLKVGCGITHDGEAVTVNEEMSPTVERMAVIWWLSLIDPRLPKYISRVYAHDLQTKSVKDLQPQLAEAMDSLLHDLAVQDDISISYTSSGRSQKFRPNFRPNPAQRSSSNHERSTKSCVICKAAGRNNKGHDVSDCWFLSKFDKQSIAKALRVDVDVEDEDVIDDDTEHRAVFTGVNPPDTNTIQKVQSDVSPFFFSFFGPHPCHVVLDTGANSSLLSRRFAQLAGISIKPSKHSARSVDKSSLTVVGECKINLTYGALELPLTVLVVDILDCDVLAGIPFCKDNDVILHLKEEAISIHGAKIKLRYGSKPTIDEMQNIYKVESLVLRSDQAKVLLPGEYVEFQSDSLNDFEGEVAIEPHVSSPMEGTWPPPSVSRVIHGTVRIANATTDPIPLRRAQHFAQIRRVISDSSQIISSHRTVSSKLYTKPILSSNTTKFSDAIQIDPDGQLTKEQVQCFRDINHEFDSTFDPNYKAYNDYSGTIRAKLNMGPVGPPPQKGKIPLYKHSNLQLLQEEADKLEALGVLVKPEDVGVDVEHVSPSFLVGKKSGGYRLVTAFNNLSPYTKILPCATTSCNDVLRQLSKWKYIIKSDLTQSFFQIPLAKSSMKFLATVTPFKGIRVYARSAMGQPGSSEYLSELLSRVLGDFMQEGFLIKIADDIYVCGSSVEEAMINWHRVLQRLEQNSLNLSASKTVICPISTTILGWLWKAGTLTPCAHKIAPLASVSPPSTCSSMRSFIGAFKALSKCIPKYASFVAPLEDSIKGLEGQNRVEWNDDLMSHFCRCQEALKSPETITIPNPNDKLILTVDASPVNNGLGATLFVLRNEKRLLAGFFSFKMKGHQLNWLPCEHEALGISSAINFFSPFIRESKHSTQVLTDSKPCVEAYHKLCKGQFSASNRISTYLSTLSSFNVQVCHLKGTNNQSSDFASRNPRACNERSCQVCKFVYDTVDTVVNSVTVNDVLSGSKRMPFLNQTAWKTAQHDCENLRRTFAHLSQGTRPSRKARNLKDLRRYLRCATINEQGLLIVRKEDPYLQHRDLIVVPQSILHGLLSALHLQFGHPSKNQLQNVFNRYYFALNCNMAISDITDQCPTCNSLKSVPREIIEQTSTPSPVSPGAQFAVDVLRRTKQKIFVARDVFSSFTTATIIPDEKSESLRSALIRTTALLRLPSSSVRVDGATGFLSLEKDSSLIQCGITLDYGQVKNKNKNPVIDKGIQEIEDELLRYESGDKTITESILASVLSSLNTRIRTRGLSAKEIITQRDQVTGLQLSLKDRKLASDQEQNRSENHVPSSVSKAHGGSVPPKINMSPGDLVFIKGERSKLKPRDQYMVSRIDQGFVFIQKLNNGKFMSRQYKVPTTNVYPVSESCKTDKTHFDRDRQLVSSDSSDEDLQSVPESSESADREQGEAVVDIQPLPEAGNDTLPRRSTRPRQQPPHLADYELFIP